MNFAGKKLSEFELVQLESISKFSNYNDFINDRDNNINVFGIIIVCKDSFGRTREIISGKHIPCIQSENNNNSNKNIDTIPNMPYRGRKVNYGVMSSNKLHEYVSNNYTKDYIIKINSFINFANKYYKESKETFIKKLIKKIK